MNQSDGYANARVKLPIGSGRSAPKVRGTAREPFTGKTILVIDDDPLVADALVAMLEREGRTVIVCNDAESAQVALREFPFTHVVSDLQLSKLPFEGVQLVDAARRSNPDSRIVVITGYASQIVKSTALAVGADAFLSKPFAREDIEAALGEPVSAPLDDPGSGRLLHVRAIEDLLSAHGIVSHFQPIFDCRDDRPRLFGFEALARAGEDWPFDDMRTLFDYAAQKRKLVELNAECIQTAFREGAALAGRGLLFVNVDPTALGSTGMVALIRRAAITSGVDLSRVVLELTEGSVIRDHGALVHAIDSLRRDGVAFAVDDAESAVANLRLVEEIRPQYLKISHRIGTAFEDDATKRDTVGRIMGLARAVGARTILEGIESSSSLSAARELQVELGQGFWLGEPAPAAHFQND